MFTSSVTGSDANIRLEHRGGVIPVAVTVSVIYTNGESEDVVVPVTERVVERTLPLKRALRAIEVNRDHGALVDVNRDGAR
jgi:hypothetical protein